MRSAGEHQREIGLGATELPARRRGRRPRRRYGRVELVGEPGAHPHRRFPCTLSHCCTILRTVAPAEVIALFGPTGVGKTDVAIALAQRLREVGESPVAVSADALQVYVGLETLTGAADARERAQLEHRLISFLPVNATFSAGQYAELAHAEIDGLLGRRPPPDRRRRHRPVPPGRAHRAQPAPRPRRGRARALDRRARGARSGRAARRPGPPRPVGRRDDRADRPPADRARPGAARQRRARAAHRRIGAVDRRHPPQHAARRAWSWTASSSTSASTRASTRCSPTACRRRSGGRAAPARRTPRARRWASRTCSAATSSR